MSKEKEDNLSIVGDLQGKLVGFLVAIASFLTVVQEFINEITSIFSLERKQAYYIFIGLYFIVPAILIALLIFKNKDFIRKNVFEDNKLYRGGYIWGFGLSLIIVVGYLYLIDFHRYLTRTGIFFFTIATLFIWLTNAVSIFKNKNVAAKEYLVVSIIFMIIISAFIGQQFDRKNPKIFTDSLENKFPTHLIEREELTALATSSKNITNQINQTLKVVSYYVFEVDSIGKNESIKNDTGYLNLKKQLENLYSLTKSTVNPVKSRTKNNINTVKNIENELSQISKKLVIELDQRGNLATDIFTDTVALLTKTKIDLLLNCSLKISSKWTEYISRADKDFAENWLPYFRMLQFRGLVWFAFLMISLFTLLYYFREQYDIELRFDANRNTKRSEIISKNANITKNYIYLLALLIVPFFKKFTEENISFYKPFLNVNLANLVEEGNKRREQNLTKGVYLDTASLTIHYDTIKVVMDVSPLEKEAVKIIEKIKEISLKKDTLLKRNKEEIIFKIKELGDKTIDNKEDRREFKNAKEANN